MRAPTAFSVLRHQQYRRIWIGNMVSQTGNWMQITGRAVLVYELTGSTTDLGTVYFLAFAPQLFLSQFAGVIADRFDRRRVLMTAQTFAMLGAVAMGLLAASGKAKIVANVGALSFVMGLVQTTQLPTQQALVPSLVPHAGAPDAVALNAASQATTRVFGPLLASTRWPRWRRCRGSSGATR